MHHRIGDKMSVIEFNERARRWAEVLERIEARRSAVNREHARRTVARRAGLTPGTLFNLANRRIKDVRGCAYEALRNLFIAEVRGEIGAWTHELDMALASGLDSEIEIREIEDRLAQAHKKLRELVG